MKKYMKQVLAFLLAVSSLLSFAMPSVFATQETGAPDPVPDSVTYQFFNADWAANSATREVSKHTGEIKEAYDAGTSNWRYEAASAAYQFGSGKNNIFDPGTNSLEYYSTEGNWIAVRIQSPGAGRYDLTLTHGAKTNGAEAGEVFIVNANVIDAALGENAAAYAEAVSANPYQENGATDAFKAYASAVNAAIAGLESVINPSYYATANTKGVTTTGKFVFEADTEYVVVFKAKTKQESAGTARVLLTSLTADYSEDQSGIVTVPDATTYMFFNAQWAASSTTREVSKHTGEIKEAYDAGTSNWRYEAASGAYQFGQGKNNIFDPGTDSLEYYVGAGQWIAVRIQSPGAGRFDLTLTHGAKTNGAELGEVFIVKADVIDAALGENASQYAEAMSQDPYQENGATDAFKAYKEAVTAAMTGLTSVIDPSYYAAANTKNVTATGSYIFEEDTEYVVVFTSKTQHKDAGTARVLINALTATYSEDQSGVGEVIPDPSNYQFYNADWKETKVTAHTAEIKAAYDAGTLNWRYEAISNVYQFRPDRGQNSFASGTQSLEIVCGTGVWVAVRIKSPGTGYFDLTLTHGVKNQGAKEGSVYIIDGAIVDANLGENAAAFAEAMSQDPYQEDGSTEAYKTYLNVINGLIAAEESVIDPSYYAISTAPGQTTTGKFLFEAEKEYVVVFKSDVMADGASTARLLLGSLTAVYSDDQTSGGGNGGEGEAPEPTLPSELPESSYTDGVYDFYAGNIAGSTLEAGKDIIAALYEADTLNWKYETAYNMNLSKTEYRKNVQSMRFISAPSWWVAFRVKAPAQDGSYNLQMTHAAGGQGAQAGEIFVFSGDVNEREITKLLTKKSPATTTDWFYGENKNDEIGGRQSGVATVNMEAGKEYIVVFRPAETSKLSENGYIWLGQLQATRVGDMVPEVIDPNEPIEYEFYHWDYPGQYLIHYKTEEELKAQIVTDVIAKEYEEGKRNWCYEKSNGYANFAGSSPFLNATIGETAYLVLRIKSPGTGTYSIDYSHYANTVAKAAEYGYVYIVPVPEDKEVDYNFIKDECDFKDPIITTAYKGETKGFVTANGIYNSFEEGKEYFVCFAVADPDNSKSTSLQAYPQSLTMTRIGDWQPEPGNEPDDGVVYPLAQSQYADKYLWHSTNENVHEQIVKRYASGDLNWKLEAIGGSATFSNKYLKYGVAREGGVMGIRIKSPGTGKYKVTLKYMLGSDSRDANNGEIYIMEAPAETLDSSKVADKMARAPIFTTVNSHSGTGLEKVSESGYYNFEKGKEYLVIFYLSDLTDSKNTTGSCWAYLDRLVLKWVGEFEPEEEHFTIGGIAVKDPVSLFRTGDLAVITEVNGHDYLAMAVYGGTMMIYDLDEWRLVDEVATGVSTPRGVCLDQEGNFWTIGDTRVVFRYNPYTQESTQFKPGLTGGSAHRMTCGEDGYLYFATYASYGAAIYRMDPKTQAYTKFQTDNGWSDYAADLVQKGDYIYVGASGENRHEIWKMNKYTGNVVDSVRITEEMKDTRYISGMGFLDDNYLWVNTPSHVVVIDVRTMEKLSQEEIGITGVPTRDLSGELDGRKYFVTQPGGLCYYDIATQTFGVLGDEFKTALTGIRSEHCFATIDDERLPGKSMITYGGMSADGVNLYAYNVESGAYVTLIGLVDTSFAYGQGLREVGIGLPGSNDIYFGANYDAPVQVYDTELKELMQEFATNGQADSFHWYQDKLYIGNYNRCVLTRMDGNQATALFQLNNDWFYQARIHAIDSGDNKVFVGTVPHVYQNGGVIAWYDLETELTYVVTGPNPEDVYYAKSSKVTVTNEWYSAVTGELVDMTKEWDKDENGDGVYQYFKGPVPLQSITKVIYRDGLLFGLSSTEGGTSATVRTDISAKIFVYDVENMKMLKTIDIGNYIGGIQYPIKYLAALEADPEISNKFWGVVSETLFSMTYDRDTNKFTIKEELSFGKTRFSTDNGWATNDMIFQDDYIYVMFNMVGGLCRVNRNNPKEYKQLLYNFNSLSEIPTNFVIGEDGDLYYTAKGATNLYVLNLDITDEERAEAKNVQDLIDLISDEVTMADRPAIEAARAAWNAMAPANQPLVNNFTKLEDAELALMALRIAALGEITLEDEAELVAIRKEYANLPMEKRMLLDFYTVSQAESIMSILRGERMVKQIAAIGEVTLQKEQLIRDVRAAYIALTIYERRLVTNIDVLNAAEATLTSLILEKNEGESVAKRIDEIGFVFFDNTKIKAAREAYDKLSSGAKGWVDNYSALVTAEIVLTVEYVLAVAIVAFGVVCAIPTTRNKIFKKKAKAE